MCLLQECVKFVVFAFNLIFVLVGAALIVLGTLHKINLDDVTSAIPDPYVHFELIPILTIVVGCVIFLIAFFGCCGALRNSPCLLTTYAVVLLTIFILQIALGIFAFLEINNKDDLSKNVNQTIDKIFNSAKETDVELVKLIQEQLDCCGTTGPNFWNETNRDIPKSCFDKDKVMYTKGCQNSFYQFLVDAAKLIGITVLALSATEVIGATFALCMANSVRNSLRRNEYY